VIDDEHKLENFIQFLGFVIVLLTLEERYEDVELPVVIQFVLLLVNLVDLKDGRRLEGPQSVLHEGQELLLHLGGEVLIACLVIPQEKSLKFIGTQIVQTFLYLSIHPLPKKLILTVQPLHEVVHLQMVLILDPIEIATDVVKYLRHPCMRVPIVPLLTVHLRKIAQTLDQLVVLEVLDIFKTEQDFVGGEPVPMDLGRIIQKDLFLLGWVPFVSHPHRDSDREGDLCPRFKVWRADEEFSIVDVEVAIVERDPGLEAFDLFGSALGV
jgi:hypothetical protein